MDNGTIEETARVEGCEDATDDDNNEFDIADGEVVTAENDNDERLVVFADTTDVALVVVINVNLSSSNSDWCFLTSEKSIIDIKFLT